MNPYHNPSLLRSRIKYDPKTGALRRPEFIRRRDGKLIRGINSGELITSVNHDGYIRFRVSLGQGDRGAMLLGHKVAWAIHHGYWPHHELDHINGIRTDNRIANLRASSRQQNMLNQHMKKGRDKDLPIGVRRVKRARGTCFMVQARLGGSTPQAVVDSLDAAVAILPLLRKRLHEATELL